MYRGADPLALDPLGPIGIGPIEGVTWRQTLWRSIPCLPSRQAKGMT